MIIRTNLILQIILNHHPIKIAIKIKEYFLVKLLKKVNHLTPFSPINLKVKLIKNPIRKEIDLVRYNWQKFLF